MGFDLIAQAASFAAEAHKDQRRKFGSGEPYINHPLRVAATVARVEPTDFLVAAAMLHDVIEDCGVTFDQLVQQFGKPTARLVEQVSDVSKPEDGNRAARKAIDREHLLEASPLAQTIKLADMIDNTRDIMVQDLGFAKVYIPEMDLVLDYLGKGDANLFAQAQAQIKNAKIVLAGGKA